MNIDEETLEDGRKISIRRAKKSERCKEGSNGGSAGA